jgi:hypothetical protein
MIETFSNWSWVGPCVHHFTTAAAARVTKCVGEKVTQNFCQNEYATLTVEKSRPNIWSTSVIINKTAQSQQ